MGLEMKKFKIMGYMKGVLIANLVILVFMFVIIHATKKDGDPITNFNMLFSLIDTQVKITFITFAAVILSKIVIEEYKNKTILVLFMYPINRKKLIISKLLIVVVFTFLSILLSDFLISGIICTLNSINNFISEKLTGAILLKHFLSISVNAFACSGMSLIPLYFGMRKKSVSATIVSSILMVAIVCGNFGNGFSLSSIVEMQILLAIMGFSVAYFSIKDIENLDVA